MGAALRATLNKKKQEVIDQIERLRLEAEIYQAELEEENRKEREKRQVASVRYEAAIKEIRDYLERIKDVPNNDFRYGPVREEGAYFLSDIESLHRANEVNLHDLVKAAECIVALIRSVEEVRKFQEGMKKDVRMKGMAEKEKQKYEAMRMDVLCLLCKEVEESHEDLEKRSDKLEGSKVRAARVLGRAVSGFGTALMVLGALTIVSAVFLTLVCPVTAAVWAVLAGVFAVTVGGYLRSDGKSVAKSHKRVGLPLSLCLFGDAFKDSVQMKDQDGISLKEELHRAVR